MYTTTRLSIVYCMSSLHLAKETVVCTSACSVNSHSFLAHCSSFLSLYPPLRQTQSHLSTLVFLPTLPQPSSLVWLLSPSPFVSLLPSSPARPSAMMVGSSSWSPLQRQGGVSILHTQMRTDNVVPTNTVDKMSLNKPKDTIQGCSCRNKISY